MVWNERWRKSDEMSIRNRIFPCRRTLRVGWILTARKTSDWQVCRIVGETYGFAHRIELVRDCSQMEKELLNALLWTTQICVRYRPVQRGDPWGLACLN